MGANIGKIFGICKFFKQKSHSTRKSPEYFADSNNYRNFVRFSAFLCIKAVWGIWGFSGLRIGNRTQFHILPPKGRSVASHSAMKCIQWTPDAEPAAVLWLIIGCKGNHSFWKKQILTQLFVLSLLVALELIAASFVAPARKVRIRLRPITQRQCGYSLVIVTIFLSNEYWTIEFVNKPLFIW